MSEAEKIIYAALAGLLLWLIQKISTYFLLRGRIIQSLLTDIEMNILQIEEACDYLKKFEKGALVHGNTLEYLDKFEKSQTSFYHSQLHELPKYFSRKTLVKISKFYYSFWELETLIDGLIEYLLYLQENETELKSTEIDRAKKKLERIYKLAGVLKKNKVTKLSELIENYEGRLGSDSMLK